MVHLVVTFLIKEGKMDDYLREVRKLRPLVLAEEGCVEYTFLRETKSGLNIQEAVNPNRLTLVEKWESPEALAVHGAASNLTDFNARVKDFLVSASARVLESV
ncbi:MAG: antibiotic biosynthesis monooxygenase [Treponema sp.]|jgi:quinol monooxygenase YgiN|nr:antibiotic biosynthesis monooxygenase [Treponema sp.]